jgi:hypothetical protein
VILRGHRQPGGRDERSSESEVADPVEGGGAAGFVAVGIADITRFPDHPGCVDVVGLIFPSLSVGCGEYRVSPER